MAWAATPVKGHCTRYGARHPIRRGALPTDRVQHTQSQEQTRKLRDTGLAAASVGGGITQPKQISHAIPPRHKSMHAQKPQNINDQISTLEIHSGELHAELLCGRAAAHGHIKQPGPAGHTGQPGPAGHTGQPSPAGRPEHPWGHNTTGTNNVARPRPVSRPRPRHSVSAAQKDGTARNSASDQAVMSTWSSTAARPASRRATGTRNGEQDT